MTDNTPIFSFGTSIELSGSGSTSAQFSTSWTLGVGDAFARKACSFATQDKDFVYFSSSADVADVRRVIYDRFDATLDDLGMSDTLELYDWERDRINGMCDQRTSMQGGLPRPADGHCRGVVAVLGERIGLPLDRDFPADLIEDFASWASLERRFRLVHPWPDTLKGQLQLVREGCFPLTGTVFEYLDARAAGVEVFVAYIANKKVIADSFRPEPNAGLDTHSYSGDGVVLNQYSWLSYCLNELDVDKETFDREDYFVQTYGVRNFINALNDRGIGVMQCASEQKAAELAMVFLSQPNYLLPEISVPNPYRLLEYFDIADTGTFHGRQTQAGSLVSQLRMRLWEPGVKSPILRIDGKTGCGKSSFLRAGILGGLLKDDDVRNVIVLAVRTSDFRDADGKPSDVVKRLVDFIVTAGSARNSILDIPYSDIKMIDAAGTTAAKTAATVLADNLARLDEDARLVVGLDQFEEIVDDLFGPHGSAWQPLLDFAAAALATGRIGFVYTLEKSRSDKFSDCPAYSVFSGGIEKSISGDHDEFLSAIINEPFECNQITLDSDVECTLITNYRSSFGDGTSPWSSLPLLSLKLYQLFEYVEANFGASFVTEDRLAKSNLAHRYRQKRILTIEDLSEQLSFSNIIEDLAEDAWRRNPRNTEAEELEDLDYFLTPFVRLFTDHESKIRMRLEASPEPKLKTLSQKIKRFKNNRLIVRDETGRNKLTHEAVVNFWPLAAKWRAHSEVYLEEERQLRQAALDWFNLDKPPKEVPTDDTSMRQAVDVLGVHLQSWVFTAEHDLSEADRALLAYATAIFQTSRIPTREHEDALKYKSAHIHLASAYGFDDLVKTFLENDPHSVNVVGKRKGMRPIHSAAWAHPSIVNLLLDADADATSPNSEGWPPITGAISQGNQEVFRRLLPFYLDPSTHGCPDGMTLLHVMAFCGRREMAMGLMAISDADPNAQDQNEQTPLHHSIRHGHWSTFELFRDLTRYDHCDKSGRNALHIAASHGNNRILRYLVDHPPFTELLVSTDKNGFDPLMCACYSLKSAAAQILIDKISPQREVTSEHQYKGMTALHLAIFGAEPGGARPKTADRLASLRTVNVLLSNPDVDLNHQAGDGLSPFDRARNLPEVRAVLAESSGFNPASQLADGTSALVQVCRQRDERTIRRLLKRADNDLDGLCADRSYAPSELLMAGHKDVVLGLLKAETIRPWAVTGAKVGLLSAAVVADAGEIVELILEMLPDFLDDTAKQQLSQALLPTLISQNKRSLFDRLIDLGAQTDFDLNPRGSTLLHTAARHDDLDAFLRLLEAGPTRIVDQWMRTPDQVAPIASRSRFMDHLNRYREAMTAPESPPPPLPSRTHNRSVLQKAKLPQLHRVARCGDIAKIDRLLRRHGSGLDQCDAWGRSPADLAPLSLREDIEFLLARELTNDRPCRSEGHRFAIHGNIQRLSILAERDHTALLQHDAWGRSIRSVAPLQARDAIDALNSASTSTRVLPPKLTQQSDCHRKAIIGDLETLRRIANEEPQALLQRDGWERTIYDVAPLVARSEISRLMSEAIKIVKKGKIS